MSIALPLSLAALLVTGASAGSVKVSHRHLVPVCRDAAPVPAGARSWTASEGPVVLTFTMRNQPRTGTADAPAGYATITFTPEAGHRYEVEVRADPMAYSQRVWREGEWTPVVRDRTTDTIVSAPPSWGPPPCAPRSGQR